MISGGSKAQSGGGGSDVPPGSDWQAAAPRVGTATRGGPTGDGGGEAPGPQTRGGGLCRHKEPQDTGPSWTGARCSQTLRSGLGEERDGRERRGRESVRRASGGICALRMSPERGKKGGDPRPGGEAEPRKRHFRAVRPPV